MENTSNISIIGAGNVIHSLVPALLSSGYKIDYVVAKTARRVKKLAENYELNWSTDIRKIDSPVILIAVSDSALEDVAASLPALHNRIVIHTAGSRSINTIADRHPNSGVLYPLQTFSAQHIVDFRNVPLCIEGSNENTCQYIKSLAVSISNHVQELDSEQRLQLHTAAVFVCNFTNLMYTYGQDILKKSALPFDLLRPLINETAHKVMNDLPENVQTGPAIREDEVTIKTHIQQLPSSLTGKYKQLSEWIQKRFSKK